MESYPLLKPTVDGVARVHKLAALVTQPMTDKTVEACLASSLLTGLESAPALLTAIAVYTRTKECSTHQFVEHVLRPTVVVAGRFKLLFDLGSGTTDPRPVKVHRPEATAAPRADKPTTADASIRINTPTVALSREQVWCVVANAFLCTFADRDVAEGDDLPSINFTEIHTARRGRNYVEITKLRLLFDYLHRLAHEQNAAPDELTKPSIMVARSQAPPLAHTLLSAAGKSVPQCTIHQLGESIDDQDAMLRLDFANRWIGGGALSDGCVQEEITFAQCPELVALRWFHRPLDDQESLVVTGYRQYSAIRVGTYGREIRYAGPAGLPKQMSGALIAVDALDFRYRDAVPQFTPQGVRRELNKLLSGLLSPLARASDDVAGGNWGCGVFGGDVQLKFLIQWLACGLANKRLHYFPFDLPYVEGMQPTVDYLAQTAGLQLSDLAECLLDANWLKEASKHGAWTALTEWLAATRGIVVPVLSSDSDDSSGSCSRSSSDVGDHAVSSTSTRDGQKCSGHDSDDGDGTDREKKKST